MKSTPRSATSNAPAVMDARRPVPGAETSDIDRCLLICRPTPTYRSWWDADGDTFSLGKIIAGRCPASVMNDREILDQWLPSDPAVIRHAEKAVLARRAFTWQTAHGVARLLPTYAAEGGFWIFLHARLARRDRLRLMDVLQGETGSREVSDHVAAAWSWLTAWDDPAMTVQPGVPPWIEPARMVYRVAHVAKLLGCSVVCRNYPPDEVLCYLPQLWEVTLLSLMCIARQRTPERCFTYRISSDDRRPVLHVEMPCIVPTKTDSAIASLDGLNHLRRATERCEGIFLCSEGAAYPYDRATDPHLYCRRVSVTVTYPSDPAREPWSDFKHPAGRWLR